MSSYPSRYSAQGALCHACEHGDLAQVKFLLTSEELQDVRPDINMSDGKPLALACEHNHLEIVRYLLTSPDLDEKANINANGDDPLLVCAYYKRMEIFKYLLESPELSKHANVYACNSYLFDVVCRQSMNDFIHYLVCNYEIELNDDIENIVASYPAVKTLFENRSLSKRLESQLDSKEKPSRLKI